MKVLISGAGIAGPTLAWWLSRYGMEATIVERAPRLRTGGYIVDFWGMGFEVADRMGLLPAIRNQGYLIQEVRVVGGDGKRIAGFPTEVFARLTGGRFISLPRSALSAAVFDAMGNGVETAFGDSIAEIEQDQHLAHVRFESGARRDFDLVVGADGLHSRVREIVFGPEPRFEKFLGYRVAAFAASGYRPRDELVYVMYTEVGQQAARFSMRDDRTMFLFIFADPAREGAENGDIRAQKAVLRARFGKSGWECAKILEALDGTEELYFDRMSQIRMADEPGSWTRGRVTLLGDAAFCVSLLAGQGSALAMAAAHVLAAELHRTGGDTATALARYQERFGTFVRKKQDAALRMAGSFAPKSKLTMFLRNWVMNLFTVPWIADLAIKRDLMDHLELPPAS